MTVMINGGGRGTEGGEQYKQKAVDHLVRFAIPTDHSSELEMGLRQLINKSHEKSEWFVCDLSKHGDGKRRSFLCHPHFNCGSGDSENNSLGKTAYRYPGCNEYYTTPSGDPIAQSAQAADSSTSSRTPLLELESILDQLCANYVLQYHGPSAVSSLYLVETQHGLSGIFLVHNEDPSGNLWRSEQRIELTVAAGKPDIRVDGRVVARMTHSLSDEDGKGSFRITAEARRKTRNVTTNGTSVVSRSASWLSPTLTQEAQVKAIGELLEENENCLRRQLEDVYLQKIKEIVDNLHSIDEAYVPKETATTVRNVCPTPGMAPHPLFAGELANVLKSRKRIE
ncbi:hypothetical protein Pmar_PMAR019900 [Perkinsus marinus ATCC 50983]|uniref:F-actin-capping protein subunit beta n=1 Tax=Perkinsus marinus (strain ATCC 50983 / TXsc) TaxID=423536 RepID=C5KBY6_PERM5|nr:hypothetical protein Pmar_PMAR019900 [Perkinsus marinus ATCC 50983]EER18017.1 hypothetical protein Pmar_PMAR019900 [Perkinsus marinus ATCC 50983]|eukprot:XP_002786221.1 hypothetical protein Pmar_PMAR019900 [Perkinsus marinus ATCC 50983]